VLPSSADASTMKRVDGDGVVWSTCDKGTPERPTKNARTCADHLSYDLTRAWIGQWCHRVHASAGALARRLHYWCSSISARSSDWRDWRRHEASTAAATSCRSRCVCAYSFVSDGRRWAARHANDDRAELMHGAKCDRHTYHCELVVVGHGYSCTW
jgi:hypothetical protein